MARYRMTPEEKARGSRARWPLTAAQRFDANVYRDTTQSGCWLWTASVNHHGYGKFSEGGRFIGAHRYAWKRAYGAIPPGMLVCHSCDTPQCVRPDHLFLGDQYANMRDAAGKGRNHITSLPGEQHPNARLTAIQVTEIRRRWSAGGVSQGGLAREYGTSQGTIHGIVSGKSWKHLTRIEEAP